MKLDHSDPLTNEEPTGPEEEGPAGPLRTEKNVTVDKSELKFSFACGATDSQSFTIKNEGNAPQTYSAVLDEKTGFKLTSKAAGSLAPGESATLTVEATGATPGNPNADVKVTLGGEERRVGLKAEVKGAQLVVTPAPASFGDFRKGAPSAPLELLFKNEGTLETKITGFSGDASELDVPAEIIIPPGESRSATFVVKSGTQLGEVKASLTPTATNLCGAAAPIELVGNRVTADVIVTQAIEFGTVGCRTTPAQTQTVRIDNFGNKQIKAYKAELKGGSRFKIVTNDTGDVPAGKGDDTNPGRTEITLLPNDPKDDFGDFGDEVLTLTLPGADPETRTVKIHMKVEGLKIAADTTTVNLRDGEEKRARLTNTGNVGATLCYTFSRGSQPSSEAAWNPDRDDTIGPNNGTADVDVYFNPYFGTNGTYNASIQVTRCNNSRNVPLCQDALPKIAFVGVED